MLSREWRCSWSSADRRCSNYIWVVDNFIAYQGATYIRGFSVVSDIAAKMPLVKNPIFLMKIRLSVLSSIIVLCIYVTVNHSQKVSLIQIYVVYIRTYVDTYIYSYIHTCKHTQHIPRTSLKVLCLIYYHHYHIGLLLPLYVILAHGTSLDQLHDPMK